jgi:hypothetical protein
MPQDFDEEMVKKHVSMLKEHFDAVQIFVSRDEGSKGGTVALRLGLGDVFARYGHAKLWVGLIEREGPVEQNPGEDE